MTISFNTIPSNTLVPLFYAEMDNQAANTAQDSGASLLIGHANNGAEIVANSLVLMPSADYARQICGAGSQLARMVEAYRQTDPFGELYVIAVPESTGAAATVTLTVTGAATETGTVNVYVGRTRVQAPVTNGDNVTMIASSIQDAINAVPTLPFTASSSAGVVTLTARHKGLCGNEIPVSLNYYGFGGGEVLPAGVQIAVATGTWPAVQNDRYGSRLWLLQRSKLTNQLVQTVRGYIRECLQWMTDDGVVSRIDLDIRRTGINELGNSITLWRRDGPVMISFDDLWSAITHGG